MKKQPQLIRNTRTEEAAIARGIAADPDTFEPTDEQFARMRPYETWRARLGSNQQPLPSEF